MKAFAVFFKALLMLMGGFQSRVFFVCFMSTCRELHSRWAISFFPRSVAVRVSMLDGMANKRDGLPSASAMRFNSSVVDISSSSLTRKVLFLALGWLMQVIIRSMRLSRAIRLRLLLMEPSGRGVPLYSHCIMLRKLALTFGPYTSGGRIIINCIPVSCAICFRPCSASYFDRA